jgi:uncharacterized protein
MWRTMYLPDTNVWFAQAVREHPHHEAAEAWYGSCAKATVAYCRATQHAYIRLLTTQGVMQGYDLPAMTNAAAWQMHESKLADVRVVWADEPAGVEAKWKEYALRSTASPKLWMDAYLAAFAMEGKHQLVTFDRAFRQFKGLDVLVLGAGGTR